MTAMVALLRGINVGGAGKLPMAQLREIVTGCGHEDVATYVQSGNVVFRASRDDTAAVASDLRTAIRASTDLDPEVHVRTAGELASVVDANPFTDRSTDPTHLHVTFLAEQPQDVPLDPEAFEPEAWALGDRVVYLYLPAGMGRSKLAARLSAISPATGTTRNWRTVTRLLALTRDLG